MQLLECETVWWIGMYQLLGKHAAFLFNIGE